MDFIITKLQKKKPDDNSKSSRKKCGVKAREQLTGDQIGSEKKKHECGSKEACDKCKLKERCIRCRLNNHQSSHRKALSIANTFPFLDNRNQEPVMKKRRFDKEYCKIMKEGTKEHLENS